MGRIDDAVQRGKSWLASPRATIGIVTVSVLVVLPSLNAGLAADDHWLKVVLTRNPDWSSVTPSPYWLFSFYDDPARTARLVDLGMAPWWTNPGLHVAFFRPVSAATHALDYLLWPHTPWLMHVHSIVWYAVLVGVAAWVYRRLLVGRGSAWIPGLAALLYGLDPNHGLPVAWLANRNATVAAVFALASLGAHDVAARSSRRAWSMGSLLLLALGLASGESAVAVVGFFLAYALILDERRWAQRLGSLAPQGVVLALWALAYRLGGFGAHGSGFYIEPLRAPLAFLGTVTRHLPLLLASELGAPHVDPYAFLPLPGRLAVIVLCLAFLAWTLPALLRLVRSDRVARFLLVGSVLAAVPACAVFPSGRLMMIAGFGLIGLVALLGAGLVEGAAWLPLPSSEPTARRLVRSFVFWSVGGHLLVAPFAMQVTMRQMVMVNGILVRAGAAIPAGPEASRQRLVIMDAPDTAFVGYVTMGRHLAGEQVPTKLLTLAGGHRTLDIARTDEQTVVVSVEGGFYREGTEILTRNRDDPMPVGSHARVAAIDIEILETAPDGAPTKAAFHFPASAEASDLVWMRWRGDALAITAPPRIGEHVTIAGHFP